MKQVLTQFFISHGGKLAAGLVTFLLVSFVSIEQQNPIFNEILGKLASYASKNSPEKIYIHTDKDIYTNGETIWFKTYLVDGILHRASEKSAIVYVELLNGNDSIVAKRKLAVKGVGAEGEIPLAYNLDGGVYKLRAFTKYMLNDKQPTYFQKNVPVYMLNEKGKEKRTSLASNKKPSEKTQNTSLINNTSIRFFPEGGHLVHEINSKIGIVTEDKYGNGIPIKGSIVDDMNQTITFFNVHHTGLGTVTLKPDINKKYFAIATIDGVSKKIQLPSALPEGYVLNLRNGGDHLILKVSTNIERGLEGLLLIGHFRGDLFFKEVLKEQENNSYSIKLNTERLADGVAHFTLFTQDGEPLCERLTFIDHPDNDIELSVKSDAENYGAREQVSFNIEAVDNKGNLLKGDFSVAVVSKSNQLPKNMPDSDIKSWLLLDSDLGGTVKDPSYFFKDNSNERKFLLDALMMTHGWRRFVWKDLLEERVSKGQKYAPEKGTGTVISGFTALSKDSKMTKTTTVSLKIPDLGINDVQTTDGLGKFKFGPYSLKSGAKTFLEIVSSGKNKRNKNMDVAIYLDNEWPEAQLQNFVKSSYGLPISKSEDTLILKATESRKEYLKLAYKQKTIEFANNPMVTKLDEVVVAANKKTEIERLHSAPGVRVFADSVGSAGTISAMDVIGRAAGVYVTGSYPNQGIRINAMNGVGVGDTGSIMYMVDGSEVNLEFVQNMDASEILFVDVLRGNEAAVYGMRATSGAIVITTKARLGRRAKPPKDNSPEQIIPGFYKSREFYSPNYSIEKPEHKTPDYRTTIFWAPNISMENAEKAPISFYTGDNKGDYMIKVQGITKDGRAVSAIEEFVVQ